MKKLRIDLDNLFLFFDLERRPIFRICMLFEDFLTRRTNLKTIENFIYENSFELSYLLVEHDSIRIEKKPYYIEIFRNSVWSHNLPENFSGELESAAVLYFNYITPFLLGDFHNGIAAVSTRDPLVEKALCSFNLLLKSPFGSSKNELIEEIIGKIGGVPFINGEKFFILKDWKRIPLFTFDYRTKFLFLMHMILKRKESSATIYFEELPIDRDLIKILEKTNFTIRILN